CRDAYGHTRGLFVSLPALQLLVAIQRDRIELPTLCVEGYMLLPKLRVASGESPSQFEKLFSGELFDGLFDLWQSHRIKNTPTTYQPQTGFMTSNARQTD
ncbi:MAG: hypothetical protein ACKOKC_11425, partial [Chthoniobacterales bacterium]